MQTSKNLSARIFLLGLGISIIGLTAIYNSSAIEGYTDFGNKYHFVKNQLIWLALGISLFFIIQNISLDLIKKATPAVFFTSLILMVLVLIPGVGSKLQGARRWLSLGLVGMQPSEFFKLSIIIYLASWLETAKPLKAFLFLTLSCLTLVMLQPDLGTAVVITASAFTLYYLSGAKLKDMSFFFILLSSLIALLIIVSPYRLRRLQTFMDPTQDPLGSSYHINQVLLGLGSGGFSGVGLGKSRQKYAYLPESTTDSIFVVVGEELGFIGGTILIGLFAAFILSAFNIAKKASNHYRRLLASGLTLLLLTQVFVNLGAMVALIPLTGMPLPFISYGGSSLITTYISLGILANIAKTK
ncbi:putative lipid II flippase FtsW [Patescibacteria group bacterium]|nr:putative lipid II flippase FtsW [Patescibacteria group bacterium]MBU1256501.1 putative lipid II flippase FtsW [Patescibacteria group bacterium]MBU1457824.1 putative lipid II flippase FtsW [Patescibacteria group bacterium]